MDTIASQRRTLVLGATGFLGTACVQALIDRGVPVTAFLRGKPSDCEFVRRRLFDQVTIVNGLVEDTSRLRQIIALHEVDCIVQCAAGLTSSDTHRLTHAVLTAAAHSERHPTIAIPLRASEATSLLKYQAFPNSGLKVAFVRLPELFGPGDAKIHRWPGSLFHKAALGEPLMPPARDIGHCGIHAAANAIVETALSANVPFPATGYWCDVAPLATSRELFQAVKDEIGPRLAGEVTSLQQAVRTTLAWYRTNAASRLDRMSQPQKAAA